jgi:hypothetical protein
MPRRKSKPEEEKEPSFELEEEIVYEKLDEQEGKTESKKESKSPLRKAKVVLILSHKNEIIIEILSNHTGERIQYNPELHSQLKEGDLINVP